MTLLLDRRGGEFKITEKVLEAAAANGDRGEVLVLLLDPGSKACCLQAEMTLRLRLQIIYRVSGE